MKLIFAGIIFALMSNANACPNLSGEYTFVKHPWNGKIVVRQESCQKISLKHMREYQDGPWELTTTYKPDGKAYEGMYESEKLSQKTDFSFHVTNFLEQGISIIDYSGSQDQCKFEHTFNINPKDCEKTELKLEFDKRLNTYVWRQIGFGKSTFDWSEDTFPLQRK
ncbi:MAG: hypothetical protein ACK5P5_13095 [Pseudobdellovibrionaceae bacterium]